MAGFGQIVGKTLMGGLKAITPAAEAAGVRIEREALLESTTNSAKAALGGLNTLGQRLTQSGRAFLHTQGPTAQKLAGLIDETMEETHIIAGQYAERLDNALAGFSKGDVEHISDVVEGLTPARSARHLQAANEWQAIMDEFSDQAHELNLQEIVGGTWQKVYNDAKKTQIIDQVTGIPRTYTDAEAASMATKAAKRPFQPRDNYVPHYYSLAAIKAFENDPVKMEKAMDMVIKRGFADDRESAKQVVKMHLRQPAEFRGGPLQHSRELDQFIQGGYDKDLRKVGARYFYTAAKRLGAARRFGADDKIASHMISAIASEGGNAKIANNLYLAFADSANPEYRELSRIASTIHAITLLSTAGIVQPSQITNVAVRAGWTRTLRGISETIRDWKGSKQWAEHTGSTLDSIHSDMSIEQPTDISKVWLRLIGLEHLDRYNRVVAAVTGRIHATDLATAIAKGNKGVLERGGTWRNIRLLEKYGISGEDAIRQGGALTHEQLRRAGYRLSKNTQFATEVLDMPEFRTTPAGRFVYLFKSYAFQQAKFIKNEIFNEGVNKGNFDTLYNYFGIFPIAAILAPVVRGMKGRKAPEDPNLELLEDMAMVGSFGMYWDAARGINNGPGAVVNWMAGPTFSETLQFVTSDVAGIGRGIYRGEGPDFTPMAKHLVKRAPLVGQYIANSWWGNE